jgi:cell wall-associated NlpC family hydrolase
MVTSIAAKVNSKAAFVNNGKDTVYHNSPLQKKIEAFKETGVGKQINIEQYDIEAVIGFAESLIGTPHKMGGYSTAGIDCSGLVKFVHEKFGMVLFYRLAKN